MKGIVEILYILDCNISFFCCYNSLSFIKKKVAGFFFTYREVVGKAIRVPSRMVWKGCGSEHSFFSFLSSLFHLSFPHSLIHSPTH